MFQSFYMKIKCLEALLAAVILSAVASAAPIAPAFSQSVLPEEASVQTLAKACSWPLAINAKYFPFGLPDTNATYWAIPYALGGDGQIVIKGSYPLARFMSIETYTPRVAQVGAIADFQIAPNPGSKNPFSDSTADPNLANQFEVVVSPNPSAVGNLKNVIAAFPPGQQSGFGWLVYRVYLADDPNSLDGNRPIPSISLQYQNGQIQRNLLPCPNNLQLHQPLTAQSLISRMPTISSSDTTVIPLNWVRPTNGAFGGGVQLSNTFSGYLATSAQYQSGYIVVIRGKAPVAPDTRAGQSLVTTPSDVRYWSISSNQTIFPNAVLGQTTDFQTLLDASGYYTIVVARPLDVPKNATPNNGVTLLPWGIVEKGLAVILRNLIPNTNFPEAIQNIPAGASDPTIRQVMGAYYPEARLCPKTLFEQQGIEACFSQ
jgi:hypothetical protein